MPSFCGNCWVFGYTGLGGFCCALFCGICGVSMGCLDDGRFGAELENGVSIGCGEVGFEEEGNGASIEDAVKVLLLGLGEDINREGLRKTPLRVAKALREGTRGDYTPQLSSLTWFIITIIIIIIIWSSSIEVYVAVSLVLNTILIMVGW